MSDDNTGLKLVMVYAGDSGLFNSVLHYAHKIIAPESYGCQLCMLTSGALGTEKSWTLFLKELALPVSFLHRDELIALDPRKASDKLPVVYAQRDGALDLIVKADEIDACVDLQSLMDVVRARVETARAAPDHETAAPKGAHARKAS